MIDYIDKDVSQQTNGVQFVVLKSNVGKDSNSRCAMLKASGESCDNERKGKES